MDCKSSFHKAAHHRQQICLSRGNALAVKNQVPICRLPRHGSSCWGRPKCGMCAKRYVQLQSWRCLRKVLHGSINSQKLKLRSSSGIHAMKIDVPGQKSGPAMDCMPKAAFLRVQRLQSATSMPEAMQILAEGAERCSEQLLPHYSGMMRLEVELPRGISPLLWLQSQSQSHIIQENPSVYFSPRRSSAPDTSGSAAGEKCLDGWGSVAGLGAAREWKGGNHDSLDENVMDEMLKFLSALHPQIRVFGGTRFDIDQNASKEWEQFGSFTFLLPVLELAESPQGLCLSCNMAWEPECKSDGVASLGVGPCSPQEAVEKAQMLIAGVLTSKPATHAFHVDRSNLETVHFPSREDWECLMTNALSALTDISTSLSDVPDSALSAMKQEFMEGGQQGLDSLLSALLPSASSEHFHPHLADVLTKVVLARRTDVEISNVLEPLELLHALQIKDPNSYQFVLSVPGGGSFVGSTPERLYARSQDAIITEAVAATRPRGPKGDIECDFLLGLDLLQSPKDDIEYTIVRDWLKHSLGELCKEVVVEVPKSILKLGAVQHLYGKLSGRLLGNTSDSDILDILHPTPAVCGCPRKKATEFIRDHEPFDRGFYAGPFGWISGQGAEFVVAIRSALIQQHNLINQLDSMRLICQRVSLYSGVGVVQKSSSTSEWNELDLKIKQFQYFLNPCMSPLQQPNVNMTWTSALVEELCRLGINTFGIAPGSRSSPLALAAVSHPQATIIPCIDERSLGFWALGFSRATGLPAPVITSSGTAVANLLPSVVEASMSQMPMLLLTADRPPELRDTGANQAIDQVKIFGNYVRWAQDLPPPGHGVPLRMILTSVDSACQHAIAQPKGPVHLNLQFREPLAPVKEAVQIMDPSIVEQWWMSRTPFTSCNGDEHAGTSIAQCNGLSKVLSTASNFGRCLIVIGETKSAHESAAAKRIVQALGWPAVADILSGWRIGGKDLDNVIYYADHVLLDKDHIWPALRPHVVLQLGGRLTSKRLGAFLEWSSTSRRELPMKWIYVGINPYRDDPVHLITHKFCTSLQDTCSSTAFSMLDSLSNRDYLNIWRTLDNTVGASIEREMQLLSQEKLVEPLIAHELSQSLPPGHGLFIGNSMPIRDMDMYASTAQSLGPYAVAANRGASGIDGVVSTAAGFATGLRRPTTLIIGDVSFLHDTNGLTLLKSGESLPPVTIVLINNGGGGIFSFLPIADSIERDTFNLLWATPQHANIEGICRSHGILHQQVTAPGDLDAALKMAWGSNSHSVVEVVTDRESNVQVHKRIQAMAHEAGTAALNLLQGSSGESFWIKEVAWQNYSIPLTKSMSTGESADHRQGLLVKVTLGSSRGQQYRGIGDVCPLRYVHNESMEDVIQQIAPLARALEGAKVPVTLALLQKGFDAWFDTEVGICASELPPSLRFGMEMAVYTALCAACGCQNSAAPGFHNGEGNDRYIDICGLIDPQGSLQNAVAEAKHLVAKGYKALKIKVARDLSPKQDACIVSEIRTVVGEGIGLRCDANRGWSYDEALSFAAELKGKNIEYIEEPLKEYQGIPDFSNHTGMKCALDETLEEIQQGTGDFDAILKLSGVICWVVKPSLLGSIDSVADLARRAKHSGQQVVLSSAFDSYVGLALLCLLADRSDCFSGRRVCHGLGTACWFAEDLVNWEHSECMKNLLELPVVTMNDVDQLISELSGGNVIRSKVVGNLERVRKLKSTYQTCGNFSFCVTEPVRPITLTSQQAVIYLHGFMGSGSDWWPVIDFFGDEFRCMAVDLPGHGSSSFNALSNCTVEAVATSLLTYLRTVGIQDCVVVGYSLGARVALQMAVLASKSSGVRISKVVSISGSAGISDSSERAARARQDDILADSLRTDGLNKFLEHWYQGPLWTGLQQRTGLFQSVLNRRRAQHRTSANGVLRNQQEEPLSCMLSRLSTGRMKPLHTLLPACNTHFLFVSGSDDKKFCCIAQSLADQVTAERGILVEDDEASMGKYCAEVFIVPSCSHAVHLEQPLSVALAIWNFLSK